MRRVALVVAVAACGSAAKPAPVAVVAVVKEKKRPPRVEPDCEDMGPLLRRAFAPDGAVDDILGAIRAECESQQWPASVLKCVADTPSPNVNDCMHELDGPQTASLNDLVAKYSGLDDVYEAPELQCADVMKATDVADWTPVVQGEEQRELARELRRPAMVELCSAQTWDDAIVTCVSDADDESSLAACEAMMEPGVKTAVDDAVAKADAQARKMTGVKAPTCEKVVAAHYGAAKWKGQAPTIVGGSRAKVIEASKKLMRDACNAEGWSADVRACVVAVDEPVCWKLAKLASDDQTWGYPAEGTVPFATGVTECDDWGAEVARVFRCQALPEDLRASLRGSFNSVRGSFKDVFRLSPETLKQTLPAIADSCRQARDSVAQVAQNAGC